MGSQLDTTNNLVSTTVMMNVLGASTTEEDEIDRLINAASWFANEYCHRNLKSRTYSGTDEECFYDGDDTSTLILRHPPVTSISALYIDTDREYGSDTLIDSDDYSVNQRSGILTLDGDVFTSGAKSIKVEYTGGYSTIPWNLVQAIKELVQYWYGRQSSKRVGIRSVGTQAESTSYETDVPKAVLDVLNQYRRRIA